MDLLQQVSELGAVGNERLVVAVGVPDGAGWMSVACAPFVLSDLLDEDMTAMIEHQAGVLAALPGALPPVLITLADWSDV